MMQRRDFLTKSALLAGSFSFLKLNNPIFAASLNEEINRISALPPESITSDEDFWSYIRECFTVNATIINLNNGGVSPQPKVVQEAHIRHYEFCNQGPSYFMWRTLDMGREPLRGKLAELAGCSPEEIAINRNSTEGLNTIIFGLNLKAGDEIVLSKYDYPNMMNAWKQREKREGIKLVWIDLKMPMENDAEIIAAYTNAITPKTKIVHITHMINWTGQLVPAKAIADAAHAKGCEVICDIAHSFSQIDFKIPDLGVDYAAASLHKWLHAPFGSGLLYIKKEKIKNVWALLSSVEPDGSDIRKFESLGTRSFASEMAIANAAEFNQMVGIKRKEARLRYLKDYWVNKVKDLPGIKFYTSQKPQYSCALFNVGFEGWKGADIEIKLFEKKKIHVVAIDFEKVNGVRVTPSVYTSLADLDRLVEGLTEISKMTPPTAKK
ncbi:MAG TPA: aminotransferase class V-fold PLP-dependent enzyme [Bacteroidia bacterium]|jgi:selenocysteine lyase/cysteine desulfurase|nr:aminotransferase class V-fold PLP-dependent enzyme [Bacteroidia bacterium]